MRLINKVLHSIFKDRLILKQKLQINNANTNLGNEWKTLKYVIKIMKLCFQGCIRTEMISFFKKIQ